MAHDVPPGELLEAEVVRAWVPLAVDALGGARQALDSANVFPVPDGDTGTNMYLTLREGAHAVRGEHEGADGARLLRLLARGALLGARGNSGVILSEWLRGLAAAATRRETLAAGLGTAART
ncbi:DAK2 domain-containing protein, partial [Isoptericola cucumis]